MRRKLAQIQSGYTLHQHHGYHICPVELSVKAVTKLLCHADKALRGRNSCSWLSLSGRVIQQSACVKWWLHLGAGEVCGIHLHYFWRKSKLIRGDNKVPKHVQQYTQHWATFLNHVGPLQKINKQSRWIPKLILRKWNSLLTKRLLMFLLKATTSEW